MDQNFPARGHAACPLLWPRAPRLLLFIVLVAGLTGSTHFAKCAEPLAADDGATNRSPAKLDIAGYGFIGNHELKRLLRLLDAKGAKRDSYDANFVEDALLILISRLNRDGYLKPRITARLTGMDGETVSYEWDHPLEEPLPRRLQARRVRFEIHKGVLYHYRRIHFAGVTALSTKTALSYFVETGALLALKQNKIYTPERLQRGLSSLAEVLARQGYENAQVTSENLQVNDETGDVEVTVKVEEGLKSLVRSIREEVYHAGRTNQPAQVTTRSPNEIYSKIWLQDYTQAMKATNYHRGYPDTAVEVSTVRRDSERQKVQIDLLAKVFPGPQVTLGQVEFEGEKKTKESVMARRVRLAEGELLDRVKAEEGRSRLIGLGIFDTVDLRYEPAAENTRDVIYSVKEGKRIDMSLLAGFGSYELLRGGLEIDQYNVFGRAHHARLRLIQSFKSSLGEYTYTMPELVGQDLDVFFHGNALRREEIDFTREEFGGGIGLHKYFKPIASDVSVRYNYQILNANTEEIDTQVGPESASVGAVIMDWRHDRRDNPLYPRCGYKIFGTLEVASEYLAGEVNYQRFEFAGSYHQPIGESRWLSLGLSHGIVVTLAGAETDLPFNRRFFPGGENSIRGYQQGEAAPRSPQGKIIGAETYSGLNLEFEQSITKAWSVVAFFDTAGLARELKDYPFDELLFSVGAGLRWKTIIGPVRLEYGYNLNRREHDPMGTLHFSIGFPF
ncbi:MAG: BamA/TamA family outer membrane protein [Verrucomicrobiales bacterium]|nr:BamA/TamA family outer membrane protein [Verrucomicrobiales bacterium]